MVVIWLRSYVVARRSRLVTVCLIELVTDLGDNVTSHSTQPPPILSG